MSTWRLKYAVLWVGPWLVFLGTAALAIWLLTERGRAGMAIGFAELVETHAASLEPARLLSLSVGPGQIVREGEVVAQLDPSDIEAEMAVARAERARLAALAEATRAVTDRQVRVDLETLRARAEAVRVELERQQGELARASAEAKTLRAEKQRLATLLEKRMTTADVLAAVEIQYAASQKLAATLPSLIEALKEQKAAAQSALEQELRRSMGAPGDKLAATQGAQAAVAEASVADHAAAPYARELEVVDRQIEALEGRRRARTLRAPATGRVSSIWKRPGEVVAAAEPVVGVVATVSDRVLACLPEQDAARAQLGERVKLMGRSHNGAALWGQIDILYPMVDQLPPRCWLRPDRPVWGRTALVLLDEPHPLVAGQSFDLALRGRPSGEALANAGFRAPEVATPEPLYVPASLRDMTRFEPSGAVWDHAFSRYLVVSDDTGLEAKNEHAPWLFAVSRDGAVHPKPLPIHGLKKVNDLESIAFSASGTLFALSSQSKTRKGNRPKARTWLIAMQPEAEALQHVGHASVFDALAALKPADLEALGLGADGLDRLDIEGLAPWQRGLLLGLKTPLDEAGRALIWHLPQPEVFLASGDLKASGLTLWARVALPAVVDGRAAAGGISSLLALPDGRFVAASTPSDGETGVHGGALSAIERTPSGALAATTLHSFPELKPEGLALSVRSGHFVVFFDTGAAAPLWMELPWPR